MGTTFSMFDTTPAGVVAAIKAAILTSTDWSNPAGDRLQCTTTRGAAMVVDLSDAAATVARLQVGVYRTTALADKVIRYLQWKTAAGATTDILHCTVSAGKEHIFIAVEGPRVGEANPDSISNGSFKPLLFLCDLLPYNTADTTPAVVLGGTTVAGVTPSGSSSYYIHVSRNAANTASWVQGTLETLYPVDSSSSVTTPLRYNSPSVNPSDGSRVLRPFIVTEDVAGMRGRLAKLHHMGFSNSTGGSDFPVTPLTKVTLGAETYIGVNVNRCPTSSSYTAFGTTNSSDDVYASYIVAVPFS